MDPAAFRRLWKELKRQGWKDRSAPGVEVGWLYIRPGKSYKDKRGVDVFDSEEAVLNYVKRAHVSGDLQVQLADILGVPLHPSRRRRVAYSMPPTTGHINVIAAATAPVDAKPADDEPADVELADTEPANAEPAGAEPADADGQAFRVLTLPHRELEDDPGSVIPKSAQASLPASAPPSPAAHGSHMSTPSVSPRFAQTSTPPPSPPMAPPSPSRIPPPSREIVEWLGDVETSDSGESWGRSDAESADEAYLSDFDMSDVDTDELADDVEGLRAEEEQYRQGYAREDSGEECSVGGSEYSDGGSEDGDEGEFVRLDSDDEGGKFLESYSDSGVGEEEEELVVDEDLEFDEAPLDDLRFHEEFLRSAGGTSEERLANHWKTKDEGGIPRGCWGDVLVRDRFMYIAQNLHFSSNSDPRAKTDRAWKIRPVVDHLQTRFVADYTPPGLLSFDEAMLPSRSGFNKMRVYMKDKPHKWGTKLFMLCCATTAYCIRLEVYCGKKRLHIGEINDHKSGPAAVVRNLQAVFGPQPLADKRLVVTDRFYTSVSLALQLYTRGFFSVGTIMTNRVGYCKEVIDKRKTRPAEIPRGTFTVATSTELPVMKAVSWWDNKPVHLLSVGGSTDFERVTRRENGVQTEVACPRVLKDYQTLMGGVDVHDQLRLQRYSLQLAVKFCKYYKSLFLGCADLAVVNAFILFKLANPSIKISHVRFLKNLHLEMTSMTQADWESLQIAQPRAEEANPREPKKHLPVLLEDWRGGNKPGHSKRRQRTCKVCSLLKVQDGKSRPGETANYCSVCKIRDAPVFLCKSIRRMYGGKPMTCFEIWHDVWNNGKVRPHNVRKRKIRGRRGGAQPRKEEASTDENSGKNTGKQSDEESDASEGQAKRSRA